MRGDTPFPWADLLIEQINQEYPDSNILAILSFELFCYDCQPPSLLGLTNEFIVASRLDNLLSCFVGLTALTEAVAQHAPHDIRMLICNNHEEIGSLTASGAKGSFLRDILQRIEPDPLRLQRALRPSLCISLDNAHGLHPNFSDKSEPSHAPLLNYGPVIKSNANQTYATSSITAAAYKNIATAAGVATQDFVMRSDLPCGSTIGPHIAANLGIPTVDVGAPTLAMHSIREMTGSQDPFLLYRTINQFFHPSHIHS
jgi:aspartyl aminopeptidase